MGRALLIDSGGRSRGTEGALPCVPLKSTKPTRRRVGIFKIRGTKEAGDDVRIDPVGRRVGPSVTLAPGITPAQWRHTQRRSPEPSQTVQEPF